MSSQTTNLKLTKPDVTDQINQTIPALASNFDTIDNQIGNLSKKSMPSVTDYGAKGDGTTDDTQAFLNAISANSGKSIHVPDPSSGYLLTAIINLPANTVLVGDSKRTTKLLHGYNGDMFTLADGAGLTNIYLEGQGATFTGRGVVIGNSDGRQKVICAKIVNFNGFPVDFTNLNAGSQSTFFDVEASQYNAATGSGKYAFNMLDGSQLSAVPRKFYLIETNGTPAFSFGGCNDTFISGSFLGDLAYTANSRGIQISSSRIANQTALTVNGHNNTIVGCDINPQITIASGADNIIIGPNSYNNLPIIDNSGNDRNQITTFAQSYTPTLSSGGTQPTLGNGTITASFTRTGSTVTVSIDFSIGSTTNLGTGDIRFSLPVTPTVATNQAVGSVLMNHAGTYYTAVIQIPQSTNYATMIRDTSGSVTYNSPAVFASGDFIRLTFTYMT